MGSPPPPDGPPAGSEDAAQAAAVFATVALAIAALCGFKLPLFNFNLSFNFPFPPSFDFPPIFSFSLALKCSLSDPIAAEVGFGGGRVGTTGLEDDPDYPD